MMSRNDIIGLHTLLNPLNTAYKKGWYYLHHFPLVVVHIAKQNTKYEMLKTVLLTIYPVSFIIARYEN